MHRDLKSLSATAHDLIIIGGGIHGLSAAWDATLRGLKVALIEQGDFGASTSANSYKIVHGGLRYLQHLNFKRMRLSINERSHLMRMAPHLIRPLPFLVPCYGHGMKGPEALRAALAVNDWVGADRNTTLDPAHPIPRGKILSRDACLKLLPGIHRDGLTGAAMFYDGQMYDSERLSLEFALSASASGAMLANHTRAHGIRRTKEGSFVVQATDAISGEDFEIQGRMLLNTSGPWVNHVVAMLKGDPPPPAPAYSKGVQIFTRAFTPEVGVALEGQQRDATARLARGNRSWFVTPWRGLAFIGTTDTRFEGDPETFSITRQDIDELLEAINAAYPPAALTHDDVRFWNGGLRPCEGHDPSDTASASHETRIIDHARKDKLDGIVSISGVKYTTCRFVAERAIDLIARRLGHAKTPCPTRERVLAGGAFSSWETFLKEQQDDPLLSHTHTTHMAQLYGSHMQHIRARVDADPALGHPVVPGAPLIRAEILHAIHHECALRLEDVIMRRTSLGSAGSPGAHVIEAVAQCMAQELDWSEAHTQAEITSLSASFVLPDGP